MTTTQTPRLTRADIIEALGHLNATAKRLPHVVEPAGSAEPTRWTQAHQRIDRMLDQLRVTA